MVARPVYDILLSRESSKQDPAIAGYPEEIESD
jgi:hypothetical protein